MLNCKLLPEVDVSSNLEVASEVARDLLIFHTSGSCFGSSLSPVSPRLDCAQLGGGRRHTHCHQLRRVFVSDQLTLMYSRVRHCAATCCHSEKIRETVVNVSVRYSAFSQPSERIHDRHNIGDLAGSQLKTRLSSTPD